MPVTLLHMGRLTPGMTIDFSEMFQDVRTVRRENGRDVEENIRLDVCPMCKRLSRAMDEYKFYIHKLRVALDGEPVVVDACLHSQRACEMADKYGEEIKKGWPLFLPSDGDERQVFHEATVIWTHRGLDWERFLIK